jgi:site-specific DNA-methyltransferase (adenine-specific)
MSERPSAAVWAIHEGDCIDVMRTLAPESIDAVITSPPYAMQRKATYGGVPEADYPAWTVAWMREVRRVLKPDGSAVINISPHKIDGGLSDYVLRTRLALRSEWTEIDEIVWHKTNAMPTGSPRRPKRTWESLLWYAKHGRAWSDAKANGHAPKPRTSNYVSRKHDAHGWTHGIEGGRTVPEVARCTNLFASSVSGWWEKTDHPAPYPPALAEWIARLICPPGGTILDPFNGSGSTGVAAVRGGWSYVGIDAVPEYVAMSRLRLGKPA